MKPHEHSIRTGQQWAPRAAASLLAALLAAALAVPAAQAQGHRDGGGEGGHWMDRGHGLNRSYPAPGAVVRVLPGPARAVAWGGSRYHFHDGVWYSPGPRGYVVVRPPRGIVIFERPAFYSVVTVGAIAYLYANGVYYRDYPGGGYQVVEPPVEGAAAPALPKTFVYPRQGQGAEQQASDEYECHRWAVSQSGFDPTAAATGQPGTGDYTQRDGYQRARGACLEGRGYTVR